MWPLDRIERKLGYVFKGLSIMSQQLDELKAEVERSRTVTEGAVTLIKSLADRIDSSADDPDALHALADELRTSDDTLAAAVAANTQASAEVENTGVADPNA